MMLKHKVIWGNLVFWLLLLGLWRLSEGENSTSGPQPYQPYEGEDYHLPYFQQMKGVEAISCWLGGRKCMLGFR